MCLRSMEVGPVGTREIFDCLEEARVASLPLFSDRGDDVYLPHSVGERPPCHYLNLPDAEPRP